MKRTCDMSTCDIVLFFPLHYFCTFLLTRSEDALDVNLKMFLTVKVITSFQAGVGKAHFGQCGLSVILFRVG